MMEGDFYIGVNGGHSKSIAFVMDKNFGVLSAVKGDSLNTHTFPLEQVTLRFETLLLKLADKIQLSPLELQNRTLKLVLSMPGAATEEDQAITDACLCMAGWRETEQYSIVDDTWAGLVAGAFLYNGTCAFAGTGASVYTCVNEEVNGSQKFHAKPNKIDGCLCRIRG